MKILTDDFQNRLNFITCVNNFISLPDKILLLTAPQGA